MCRRLGELPGVVAVYTGEDIARLSEPAQAGANHGCNHDAGAPVTFVYSLATDKVRYVGDPFAMVVAEDRYIAEDAPRADRRGPSRCSNPSSPTRMRSTRTSRWSSTRFEDNVTLSSDLVQGDPRRRLCQADRVDHGDCCRSTDTSRSPMECRGLVASWDPDSEHLTVHASTQSPHMLRLLMPPQIGVPMEQDSRRWLPTSAVVSASKTPCPREDVAVVVASIDLGPASQVDRRPARTPRVRWPGPGRRWRN